MATVILIGLVGFKGGDNMKESVKPKEIERPIKPKGIMKGGKRK